MPTSLTHQILAENTYQQLPNWIKEKITFPEFFYYGAQGGDFCFFCTDKKINFGRSIHGKNIYAFFNQLSSHAQKDELFYSYALGYLTHYAGDIIFHPYVFSIIEKKKRTRQDKVLLHHKIEHSIDGTLYNKNLFFYSLPKMPKKGREKVFHFYQEYASSIGLSISEKNLKQGNFWYFFLNKWHSPTYDKKLGAPAPKLLKEACTFSIQLMEEFIKKTEDNIPLPKENFSKNYLSAQVEKNN